MFLSISILVLYILTVLISVALIKNYAHVKGYHSLFYTFLFAQSLYVITPMFDHLVGTESYRYINELVLYSSVCTIFFAIGGMISSYRFIDSETLTPNEYILKLSTHENANKIFLYSVCLGIFAALAYLYQIYQLFGLDPLKWFGAYLSQETGEKSFGKAQVWLIGALSMPAILIYIFKDKNYLLSSVFFSAFIFILFSLLVRGNRNFLMLILLPILIFVLLKKGYLKSYIVFGLFFAFIFSGQIIDILRAVGLYSVFQGEPINSEVWLKGLSAGEFGATIRSFNFYMDKQFNFELFLGKTYLVDPFLNMATTLGIPFDVLSYKLALAMSPRGVLFGYGFSPQLESILNFGLLGGPLVYFVFGFFTRLIDILKTKNILLFSVSLYLLPILINMQRIDFAVAIKLSAIPIFFLFLIVALSKIKL